MYMNAYQKRERQDLRESLIAMHLANKIEETARKIKEDIENPTKPIDKKQKV